ncbi:MAG: hypothetical protein MKZ81_05460, partial [Dehalococcoidia bacterium]|nr:hypothetical protein [Dehalococcoidia bacterium]
MSSLQKLEKSILIRIVLRAFRHPQLFIYSLLSLLGAGFLTIAAPWLAGYAIDSGLGIVTSNNLTGEETTTIDGNASTLLIALSLIAVVAVARGGFVYAQTYLAERLG